MPRHPSGKQPWFVGPAAVLARALLRTLLSSCRVVSVVGRDHLAAQAKSGQPAVFTFWHNRSNYCGYYLNTQWAAKGHPLGIMTSTSRDGEIIARIATSLGLRVARGSVGQRGLAGLKTMHRMVARESISVLTVADGSRGPKYEAQAGVVVLAQMSGAPVLPMSFAASSCWRATSWDRMIVPKPFSRIAVAVGDPISYPKRLSSEELERAQSTLGETLHELAGDAEAELAR